MSGRGNYFRLDEIQIQFLSCGLQLVWSHITECGAHEKFGSNKSLLNAQWQKFKVTKKCTCILIQIQMHVFTVSLAMLTCALPCNFPAVLVLNTQHAHLAQSLPSHHTPTKSWKSLAQTEDYLPAVFSDIGSKCTSRSLGKTKPG